MILSFSLFLSCSKMEEKTEIRYLAVSCVHRNVYEEFFII